MAERLKLGLVLLFVLALWAPEPLSVGLVNLNVLPAVAILAVLAVATGARPRLFVRRDAAGAWVLLGLAVLIAISALISAFWADEPFRVFRVTYGYFLAVPLVLGIATLPNPRKAVGWIVAALIVGAVVSALFATAGYVLPGLRAMFFGAGDRTSAFFKHSNQFGMILAMVFPLMIALCFTRGRLLLKLGALFVIFVGLVLTGSKTNLVLSFLSGLTVAGVLMAQQGVITRRPAVALGVVVGIVVFGAAGFFAMQELNPRSVRLLLDFASDGEIQSTADRSLLWRYSAQQGLDHPFTGVGAGQRIGTRLTTHSHNVLLDMLRTLGIPGLAMVLALIAAACTVAVGSVFRASRLRGNPAAPLLTGLAFGIVNYVLSNQLSDSFGPSTLPFLWVFVGLIFLCDWTPNARPAR